MLEGLQNRPETLVSMVYNVGRCNNDPQRITANYLAVKDTPAHGLLVRTLCPAALKQHCIKEKTV